MTYKFVGSDRTKRHGICINLSDTGILFTADRRIATGKALEIYLKLDKTSLPPMAAFIEVIRSTETEDDAYEIGASIRGIKGN